MVKINVYCVVIVARILIVILKKENSDFAWICVVWRWGEGAECGLEKE